jgi:transposase
MPKIKPLSFEGQTIFCGIDVHKNSWRVNIRNDQFELEDYTQDPCENLLLKHLSKRYPGATFQVAYEAGFSGFGIQRSLKSSGVKCLVVNPADVPSTDKDKKRKNDQIDARKICRHLSNSSLKSIYIPNIEMEHARSLVRQRARLVKDQTRCKNRIWHLLMFSGLKLDMDKPNDYWSRRFVESIMKLPCQTEALRQTLNTAIEEYLFIRKLVGAATKQIRNLSLQSSLNKTQQLLQSIPGIGLLNSMIILTELQDMKRFKTFDKLCSYAGIVPDSASSGESSITKGMTHRSNKYLRPAIVESSWVIIRKDPAMLHLYKKYCRTMVANKAIIKISRHLLSRIRYVWTKQVEYEIGIVG